MALPDWYSRFPAAPESSSAALHKDLQLTASFAPAVACRKIPARRTTVKIVPKTLLKFRFIPISLSFLLVQRLIKLVNNLAKFSISRSFPVVPIPFCILCFQISAGIFQETGIIKIGCASFFRQLFQLLIK